MLVSFRKRSVSRGIVLLLVTAFISGVVVPPPGHARMMGAAPVDPEILSGASVLPGLLGIRLDPGSSLRMDFVMDRGDLGMSPENRQKEYYKVIRYFMAALTTPNADLWVNLSPLEQNRIVPDNFICTDMGKDLLGQDYILKRFMAELLRPSSTGSGKKFWERLYRKVYEKFGTTDIPLDTFNKVWIRAEKADIFQRNGLAVLVDSRLKVMLEQDYMLVKAGARPSGSLEEDRQEYRALPGEIVADVVREVLIPLVEKEVNEGVLFGELRQIYSAQIMATWFKQEINNGILGRLYADKNKVAGIETDDPSAREKIYKAYLDSFQRGESAGVLEEMDMFTGNTVLRKYFTGGAEGVSARILRMVDAGDAAMSPVIKRALAGLVLVISCLFVPLAQGAVFERGQGGDLMAVVQKGDTLGEIVQDVREQFQSVDPGGYRTSAYAGELYKVVGRVTGDRDRSVHLIYPGEKIGFSVPVPVSVTAGLVGLQPVEPPEDIGSVAVASFASLESAGGAGTRLSGTQDPESVSSDYQRQQDFPASIVDKKLLQGGWWEMLGAGAAGIIVWEIGHNSLFIALGWLFFHFWNKKGRVRLKEEESAVRLEIGKIISFLEQWRIKEEHQLKEENSGKLTSRLRSFIEDWKKLQSHFTSPEKKIDYQKLHKQMIGLYSEGLQLMRQIQESLVLPTDRAPVAAFVPGGIALSDVELHVDGDGVGPAEAGSGQIVGSISGLYPVIRGIATLDAQFSSMPELQVLLPGGR